MRIVMMGAGTFAEPTFMALLGGAHPVAGLITQPDRSQGQRRGSTRQTGQGMKPLALDHGIAVFQPQSINTPEGVESLHAMKPDLLVVAAYGQILSQEVLEVPPLGGINVHGSLLPKYRGAAPVAWAIYHGETETGVTIIRMSTKLDAGAMLAKESLTILPNETAGELEARLAPLGARLAMGVIAQMENGAVRGDVQDASQVTKAPKLKKENGLIDWSRSAEQICCQIRAMLPWPTAYTFWRREGQPPLRMIVHRARALSEESNANMPPGSIMPDVEDRLIVVADDGKLVEAIEVQPAGKRRMSAKEFVHGRHPQLGDRFGSEDETFQ